MDFLTQLQAQQEGAATQTKGAYDRAVSATSSLQERLAEIRGEDVEPSKAEKKLAKIKEVADTIGDTAGDLFAAEVGGKLIKKIYDKKKGDEKFQKDLLDKFDKGKGEGEGETKLGEQDMGHTTTPTEDFRTRTGAEDEGGTELSEGDMTGREIPESQPSGGEGAWEDAGRAGNWATTHGAEEEKASGYEADVTNPLVGDTRAGTDTADAFSSGFEGVSETGVGYGAGGTEATEAIAQSTAPSAGEVAGEVGAGATEAGVGAGEVAAETGAAAAATTLTGVAGEEGIVAAAQGFLDPVADALVAGTLLAAGGAELYSIFKEGHAEKQAKSDAVAAEAKETKQAVNHANYIGASVGGGARLRPVMGIVQNKAGQGIQSAGGAF